MSEQVHNRLAVIRAERSVSRKQLAEAVGAHYQTIGHIERGQYNPSLDLALRIAEYFELPVEVLFALRPFRPLSDELYGADGTHRNDNRNDHEHGSADRGAR
ncbi:helix-turn-helix transcriptional regulator [Streptomyces sp. NBC_01808]|uniref:helix-turn-helix transcriptional regulator n=1 Tax=Streptomyces sp. NBC_01808 TaxID=2975947 RepID=UPI002DD9146C|nr:helix-turn-helix transcriptional regulator [Streptomyces sp. NBC_01808]WSA38463.1 helix-turn-helix transcriptional regulator [Streptomyces sp. NBC_01808]